MTVATAPGIEPGLHRGLPMAEYLALPCMSASGLEKLRRSPLQYRHSLGAEIETTDALERGTALHLAILEPQLFEGHYIVLGQCEGTKKNGERCQYQASTFRDGQHFCGTHDPYGKDVPVADGVEIITARIHDQVVGMRDAVLAHDRARTLFEGAGEFEATIVFEDPGTGVLCKIRPDRLIERAGMHVEVKTTRDASEERFKADAERRGYFRKLALYRRGLRAIGSDCANNTIVLAIESEAPHDLNPFLVDEGALNSADREVTRLLERYRDCETHDDWPGYARDFTHLTRPAWATKNEQED